TFLHLGHCSAQQGGHPDDVGSHFLCLVDKCIRAHVNTHIADLESGSLEHHADQILADVVQISLHSSDHCPSHRFVARFHKLLFQDRKPRVHRAGGYQDFRNEDFIVLKLCSHDHHAGQKPFIQDRSEERRVGEGG